MHSNCHVIGHADLLNDEVRKVGKNGHRLEVNQENVSLEEFVLFLQYITFRISEEAEDPKYASQRILSRCKRSAWEAKLLESVNHVMGFTDQIPGNMQGSHLPHDIEPLIW
ncbi:MAG: hypothetical protein J2P36_03205 [Ktedonobacteraceae bacterium]|nr:hypothetical protein [Ktedonobacteraceae bacterium]